MGWNTFIILQHTSTCTYTSTHRYTLTSAHVLNLSVSVIHTHTFAPFAPGLISQGCVWSVWNDFVLALSLNPSDSNEAMLKTHPQFQIRAGERTASKSASHSSDNTSLSLVHFRFLISAKLICNVHFYTGFCVYWYLWIALCQQNKCCMWFLSCNAFDVL